MFESGYWRVFSWKGVPVRLHWTLPLGALLFSGGAIAPAFWLAFFLLVFLHELGHAVVVRKFRYRVSAIDITGFGGMCRWAGSATPVERSLIAWGGVGAQAIVLFLALALVTFVPWLGKSWMAPAMSVFVTTNLWLMGLNLLPFPPLDGAQAWRLFSELRRPGAMQELKRALLPRPSRAKAQAPWMREGAVRTAPRAKGRSWFRWPWGKKTGAPSPRPRDVSAAKPTSGGEEGTAPRTGEGGMAPRELADMLRNIGEQAGKARKADKRDLN